MTREHTWTGDDDSPGDAEPDAVEVRHVQPYEAVKPYRCPGCDHEIRAGEGHEVVVPRTAPDERRHWHSGCWRGELRRREGRRSRSRRAR